MSAGIQLGTRAHSRMKGVVVARSAQPGVLFNLQALRALAALLVVTHHLDGVLAPTALGPRFFLPGNVGVDIFFIISGFVMVHTITRRPASGWDFALNRLIRVAPLYWALTLMLGGASLAMPALFNTLRTSPAEILYSLLFVPYSNEQGLVYPALFVGWTLNYEMFFYGLFGLALALFGGSLRRVVPATCIALATLVVVGWVLRPSGVIPSFYTDPILLEFGMGMVLAKAYQHDLILPRKLGLVAAVGGMALLIAFSVIVPTWERALFWGIPSLAVVGGALSLEHHGTRFRARLVQLLGGASYALYLIHPLINMPIGRISNHLDSAPLGWALAFLALLVSTVLAVAIHIYVERPVTARLRALIGHAQPIADLHEGRAAA